MRRSAAKARTPSAIRKALIAGVGAQVRRMGAQNVLTSKAVAGRFGLHTTDLECLDLIYLRQRTSAGDLAKATGLTSGSVTALIDRLEEAGYVERVADPTDRRRREVRVRPGAIKPIQAVYQPIHARMVELWSTFGERDLEVIIDFLSRSTDLAVACSAALRGDASASPSERRPPRTSHRGPKA